MDGVNTRTLSFHCSKNQKTKRYKEFFIINYFKITIMKKYLFLAVAATAMMASCSNDEVVEMASQQGKAIAFENAFVNNSTRAALVAGYNSSTLPADIEVFGSMTNAEGTATWIFNDVKLEESTNWTYSPLQYWVPGNGYKFYALAPADQAEVSKDDAKGTLTSLRFENDGATDLLYAYVDRSGNNYAETPVAFTLNHLLSKVKFSMTNGFASDQATIKVTNIAINGINEAALYTISDGKWTTSDPAGLTIKFGNIVETGTEAGAEALAVKVGETKESNYERFLIPEVNTSFEVTFTAELLTNNVTVGTYNLKTNLTNIVLEQGKSYNFIATLTEKNITGGDPNTPDAGLKPITFTVAVSDWEAGNGWDVTANEGAGAATDDGTYNGGEIVTGNTTTSGN